MATILSALGFLGGAAITGFGFAGGALVFSKGEQLVEQKIRATLDPTKKEDSNISGSRYIRDNKTPFAETRFLNHLERRAIAQNLLKDIK